MEWNFDNVKFNGKDLDRVQVDGVTVWEKKKVVYYEYCRNTATTRIDTGIAANNNTRLEFKLWGNVTDSFYSMGTRTGSSGNQLFSLTGGRANKSVNISIGTNSSQVPNLTRTAAGYTYSGWFQTNGDMTYSYYLKDEGTNTEYNDSNISYTQSLADNNLHIFLFSNGYNNIVPQLRLYYVRIYQDGVLVRDFRPAKVNGVDGLYDEVTKQLFTADNLAVGGNEIKYYDYLQTESGAYIDTGFKPNQDSRVLADILLLNSNLTAVFGTRNNSGGPSYDAFVLWNSPALYYQYGNVTYSTYKLSDAIVNEHITIDLNKNVGILNNNSPVTCNTATFQTNYPFLIGNIHTASSIDPRPTPMKVYSFKIYDNGTLVRDFKPCLYNNQAGLWDSVEGKFYGNANSTGTLTVGND